MCHPGHLVLLPEVHYTLTQLMFYPGTNLGAAGLGPHRPWMEGWDSNPGSLALKPGPFPLGQAASVQSQERWCRALSQLVSFKMAWWLQGAEPDYRETEDLEAGSPVLTETSRLAEAPLLTQDRGGTVHRVTASPQIQLS